MQLLDAFVVMVLMIFVQAPAGRTTVWSGVYTDAQAAQGQAVYAERCSRCHGGDLNGAATGTGLTGERFTQLWREDNVGNLFTKIRETMPRGNGGVLKEEDYVSATAFILQRNGFPAGSQELKPETMRSIHIEAKEGPQPFPTNSMIQVVGCMAQDGDNWTLTQASSASRTRTPNEINPDDLKIAQNTPLGTATWRLQNLALLGMFKPETHKGHKMLAKGPLIRRSSGEHISVTALQMVEERCGQ